MNHYFAGLDTSIGFSYLICFVPENAEKLVKSSIKEEKKSEILLEQESVNDKNGKENAEVVAPDVFAEEGRDAKVEKAAHTVDDNEDDLLLREQLLQSLARKRAEKARAMIAVSSFQIFIIIATLQCKSIV